MKFPQIPRQWLLPTFISLIVGIRASIPAYAILEDLSLEKMVERSEIIVVGEAVKLERTGKTYSGGTVREYKATIEIEMVIKGDLNTKQLEVIYVPPSYIAEAPDFRVAERILLFIERREGKQSVVNRMGGKVEIQGKKVKPLFVAGEPKEQSLEEFITKIKAVIQRRK